MRGFYSEEHTSILCNICTLTLTDFFADRVIYIYGKFYHYYHKTYSHKGIFFSVCAQDTLSLHIGKDMIFFFNYVK